MSHLIRASITAVALTLPVAALAQPAAAPAGRSPWRAADGVTVDEVGDPQYSTFSLCAIDPATGQSGAAVTTRVPFVGRAVPWARAGVGAVCTQASTMVEYGQRGLDLMAKGVDPKDAIAQLLADDMGRESRQLGMIDMKGRAAAHTGKSNNFWAGSRQGTNYTVQANIMVGPEVVEAVATTFEASEGTGMPLAERMILALEAGQAKGGDSRWGNLQSAAIRVADPNDPGRGNDNITLAIEVGEHAEPVGEMKRIYYTTQRRLGYRSFSQIEGPDVVELKRMLHALGYWRPSLAAFPATPVIPNTARDAGPAAQQPGAIRQDAGRGPQGRRRLRPRLLAVRRRDRGRRGQVPRRQEARPTPGNPPGLVDERFVSALRTAVPGEAQDQRRSSGAVPPACRRADGSLRRLGEGLGGLPEARASRRHEGVGPHLDDERISGSVLPAQHLLKRQRHRRDACFLHREVLTRGAS